MRWIVLAVCMLTLLLPGCNRQDEIKNTIGPVQEASIQTSPAAPATVLLFHEPLQPQLFELPAEALVAWRVWRAQRPTLVLLADEPYLAQIPAELQAEALALIESGSDSELKRRADFHQPDPAILGSQAVRAALLSGLFKSVVWVLPDNRPLQEFSVEVLEEQLHQARILPQNETLQKKNQPGITGFAVEGVPVTVIHPDALAEFSVSGPVIVHFDLSYFKSVYVNEIRTPAFTLLSTLARMLSQTKLPVLVATLSYSTNDFYVSPEGRFTLPVLAQLMRRPELLQEEMPASWKLHKRALNAQAMYQESETTAIYDRLLHENPENAGVLYAVAQRRFYQKDFAAGMNILDRAVALDPGYGVAYLSLAEKAEAAGDLKNVRMLLEKARTTAPDNPFTSLRYAEFLQRMDERQAAEDILADLAQLPWSTVYHAEIPTLLDDIRKR